MIAADLAELGFPDAAHAAGEAGGAAKVIHITCGRDCGREVQLLATLAALKQQLAGVEEEDLMEGDPDKKLAAREAGCVASTYYAAKDLLASVKKPPTADEVKEKIHAELQLLAKELATPSNATGQAIITFATQELRDNFVSRVKES